MEVPLEDRQRRVRFKGQVYGKILFFFASFQWLGKTEIYAHSWNEYDVSDRCLDMNTKSRNKYNVLKLVECFRIDRPTMTRNWYNDPKTCHVMALIQFEFDKIEWYNDSKLIQWLIIDTMTRNRFNNSKLIQWLEIVRPTMTRNW